MKQCFEYICTKCISLESWVHKLSNGENKNFENAKMKNILVTKVSKVTKIALAFDPILCNVDNFLMIIKSYIKQLIQLSHQHLLLIEYADKPSF